jgi:ribonucleotide reductase alpha subunit
MVGGGEFIVVNKYLVKDLEKIGMWTEDVRSDIIANEGSIQKMHNIPKHVRDIYKTVWEIPQKKLVDLAIIRSPYVDQSQSMNVYHAEAKYSKISTALMYAWKNKLKTGVYYTRTESKLGKNSKLSGSGEDKVTKPSTSMFSCEGGGCDA